MSRWLRSRSGGEVTAHAEVVRADGAGSLVRVEALVRDVSERKKLDDQSRELYQQLLQAEKMAALGRTISGVAHELNNPLATILSWSERLSALELDDTARRGVTTILGINAFHGDSAACLIRDGEIVAAAEEERFRRIKHWAGFPSEAIRYCLDEARIGLAQVEHVAINQDASANLGKKVAFMLTRRPELSLVLDRLSEEEQEAIYGD